MGSVINKLCNILKAHINEEYGNCVKDIKYITQHVNKYSDMATFTIGNEGERDDVRFRVMKLFGYDIHQRYPTVVNSAVHLENVKRLYFTENTADNLAQILPETNLTALFKLPTGRFCEI